MIVRLAIGFVFGVVAGNIAARYYSSPEAVAASLARGLGMGDSRIPPFRPAPNALGPNSNTIDRMTVDGRPIVAADDGNLDVSQLPLSDHGPDSADGGVPAQ